MLWGMNYSFADGKTEWCAWENAKTWDLAEWCINSKDFFINTKTLTPGWKSKLLATWEWEKKLDWSTTWTVNRILGNLIQKMITIMWIIALFIMTIGWGYMIFHMWEESLLSRWKTIFMWGLISLVVALWAWILVQLVTYLLYAI